MSRERVKFGELKTTDGEDSGFVVEEDDAPPPPRHGSKKLTSSPALWILVGALVFGFCAFTFGPSQPKLAPLMGKFRDDQTLEKYKSYRAQLNPDEDPASLQELLGSVVNQVQAVARAEAVNNLPAAKHELRKLMLLDGGDARSPLYKFCAERAKEYH